MDDKTYYALEALSQSGAKTLLQSPATYRHERDNPKADTPAFAFGRLVHALILEPTTVQGRFSTGPDLSGVRTKDGKPASNAAATAEGKALVAEWLAANPTIAVVSQADWEAARAAAAAMLATAHPVYGLTLRELLALPDARTELPILWTDSETGTPMKAKLDAVVTLASGQVLVLDPKTTASALTASELSKSVANFGYSRQAANYLEALAQEGVCDAEFWFIFGQKVAPYETAWIRLSGAALTVGAQEMAAAKAIFAACTTAGAWPSAQVAGLLPVEIGLPGWFRSGLGVGDE